MLELAAQLPSTPALSRTQPSEDAYDNHGPERVADRTDDLHQRGRADEGLSGGATGSRTAARTRRTTLPARATRSAPVARDGASAVV
ncbi:hypothetical protein CWE27_24205 [Streptomyces sp. EAG2]|nr:hypothetical protein CWE27_24205 [Streptomyces sp. EAG2]